MSAASTAGDGDQKIEAVVSCADAGAPGGANEIVKVPLVMLALNVSRCTSLVFRRELGDDPTMPVASPVSVIVIGATGTFCKALPNTIENGPPLAPSTATLPLSAGIVLSWLSTSTAVGLTPGVKVRGVVAMPLYDSVTVSVTAPPLPPRRRYWTALPVPSVVVVTRALPVVLIPLATSCCKLALANCPANVIVTVVALTAVAVELFVPKRPFRPFWTLAWRVASVAL